MSIMAPNGRVCGADGWVSKVWSEVTVSLMEEEYVACFFAIQEIQDVVWIWELLHDIGLERIYSTQVS